jgi:hypothetical protein
VHHVTCGNNGIHPSFPQTENGNTDFAAAMLKLHWKHLLSKFPGELDKPQIGRQKAGKQLRPFCLEQRQSPRDVMVRALFTYDVRT